MRDDFEFELIDRALDRDLPILGVCRGLQAMNVFLGGSLVLDLVSARFENHEGTDHETRLHKVTSIPNTLMDTLMHAKESDINSFHHQAIDRPGRGLIISATSYDGVPEAAEWVIKDSMPFLMLVQWHPERLIENELSQKIALMFLREVDQYQRQS